MKTTFRQFIKEASVGENISPTIITLDRALETVVTHCRSNRGLYANHAFFKGFPDDILDGENYAIADTTLTTRKSQNTFNFYTMILDENAKRNGFPLRSKSLVGSTSDGDAGGYAGANGLFAMIPFDSAKVGFVNDADMWDKYLTISGTEFSMDKISEVLRRSFGIKDDSLDRLKEFDKKLQDHTSDEFGRFVFLMVIEQRLLGGAVRNRAFDSVADQLSRGAIRDDSGSIGHKVFDELLDQKEKDRVIQAAKTFVDDIFSVLDHEKLGMTFKKGNAISESDFRGRNEIWIEGKVLLVRHYFASAESPYEFEFGPALKERIK